MNTISMEMAKAISEKHGTFDQIDDIKSLNNEDLSPTEVCAALLVQYATTVRKTLSPTKTLFGAKILDATVGNKPCFQVKNGNIIYPFDEIPTVIMKMFCCTPNNCHQNCINASVNNFPAEGIIHTSEVSILPKAKTGLDGVLHSYIEYDGQVYDLKFRIRMAKSSYDKLFNVNEISKLRVSKVKEDYANGTMDQISKAKVSTEVYLMSREACVNTFGKGK